MNDPIAYLNGEFIPFNEMKVSVVDAGFMQGVTVAEQMRTFGGRLFRTDAHLARLRRSLDIVGVDPGVSLQHLGEAADQLVTHNHPLLASGDDLGLSLFVTPGPYANFVSTDSRREPTVGIHTYPIAFASWAAKYESGQRLIVSKTRQVSPQNWPAELKCRSRMHYYLADREARGVDAEARAILLDLDGFVSEASTANVLAYFANRGLVSPPHESILPGISLRMVKELAAKLEIPFHDEAMKPEDLAKADEVLLCSTSPCVLPVVALDGEPIGGGEPGKTFHSLLEAWGHDVGLDIAAQARRFATRE